MARRATNRQWMWTAAIIGGALMIWTGRIVPQAGAQVSRSVAVTVLSAGGTPVANALVCIGTVNDRAALGGTRTNASGGATLALPAETTATMILKGSFGGAGGDVVVPARIGLATVRLAAAGGPACPPTTRQVAAPGQISVPRAAIDRALAASATNAPITRIGAIDLGKSCFGAAGQNCGAWTRAGVELSSCNPVTHTCAINAGSWQHDECCVRNPQGAMCDGKMEELVGSGQVCQAEFEMAVQRLASPFTWIRFVNFDKRNTAGVVDHADYCAPAGTFVNIAAAEQRLCCTRQARPLRTADVARLTTSIRSLVPLAVTRMCT